MPQNRGRAAGGQYGGRRTLISTGPGKPGATAAPTPVEHGA